MTQLNETALTEYDFKIVVDRSGSMGEEDCPGGKSRWDYYRLRTESHNTLTIDDANQDPGAKAPLVRFAATPERAHAVPSSRVSVITADFAAP